ncbi:Cilia- and flagella-associated protein 251 [Hondaea fermentalgiana]|uniref:Cilia- and flagella-associated protein 251 n=1 Tax=Hondaea fermentalgiana TaxID=2315210 RepID=A0A2R5GUE9_9STRA|nr:Cilia- and flagella-associated protein 251 [Hondaea fermentalgiana]|eukprot:GBG32283.1 Cilia- and flagella-associated protein 251 [Hondaea fermentalgiana]
MAGPADERGAPEEKSSGHDDRADQLGQALALKWSFGCNKDVRGSVHNLSDDNRNVVFYLCAHTGVLYDYVHRRQTLLQGHCNPITACAVSADKRWIVTADAGADSMIVVWDSYSGTPIKTIFNPHENGVVGIDISPDAMLIASLGSSEQGQEVSVWEWTVDHDGALYTRACPRAAGKDKPLPSPSPSSTSSDVEEDETNELTVNSPRDPFAYTSIQFSGANVHEFVTTAPQRVTFWSWAAHKLECRTPPPMDAADFGTKIGHFAHTIFLSPGNAQTGAPARAVSGTEEGNLVLWEVVSTSSIPAGGAAAATAEAAAAVGAADAFLDEATMESKTTTLSDMPARIAVKVVKLNRSGGIPFMTMCDDLLVVCGTDESVRFYDMDFRIVAWYEDLEAGPINSVSFANTSQVHYVDVPVNEAAHAASASLSSAQAAGDAPIAPPNSRRKSIKHGIPDFVVGTTRALLVGVDAAIFEEASSDHRHGTLLLQGFDGALASVCTHPMEPYVVAVSRNGVLQGWEYEDRRLEVVKVLHPDDVPSCLAFSPDGALLAVGFENGMVRLLRWASKHDLAEVACFQIRPGTGIVTLRFSLDGRFLGVADTQHAVGLYRFVASDVVSANGQGFTSVDHMKVDRGKRRGEAGPGLEPGDGSEPRNGWTYLGRYISHTAPVTCLTFGLSAEGANRFFSTARDGTLVEYDLEQSSVVDGIKLATEPVYIEHGTSEPTFCIAQTATRDDREDTIITCNTDFKFKVFNANNKSCRKTTLGPTFGGPISCMQFLASSNGGGAGDGLGKGSSTRGDYIAYATAEKVIGLVKTPLDGNPFKMMGLIAHPGPISGFATSFDGKYLITAGGPDMTCNLWTVNTPALDLAAVSVAVAPIPGVPASLLPYMPLLDPEVAEMDGQEATRSAIFEDIVDFFFYAQIRCQGEETTSPRRAEGRVPLREIPSLMRALSFYPSEKQIEDMCVEVRYADFASTARTRDTINLEDLVRLYINHRPVSGVTLDEISSAISTLSAFTTELNHSGLQTPLNWSALQAFLGEQAESLPPTELQSCLVMLMGRTAVDALKPTTKIAAESFCADVLGLQPLAG